jgi:S1-C subfamily serine protease
MKKLAVIISLISSLFSTLSPASASSLPGYPPDDLVTLAETTTKSVVSIICGNSIGSGWSASVNLNQNDSQKGYKSIVITNHHVISSCTSTGDVTIVLSNQTRVAGVLSAWDESNDLASVLTTVIIPKLRWEGQTPQQGWWVGVIGSPLGFPGILTTGIISSINKTTFIGTTDAAINPGNSGGPVFDRSGRVVGLATAKYINAENFGIFHGTPLLCIKIFSCADPSGIWTGSTIAIPSPTTTPKLVGPSTQPTTPVVPNSPQPSQSPSIAAPSRGVQAKIVHASKDWSARITSFKYLKGINPLVGNKPTILSVKGFCTKFGKTIQAYKNTGSNGVKYPNGDRYVTPQWKCINGLFQGQIEVTGNTRFGIFEVPSQHIGTEITFKPGVDVSLTNTEDPSDPGPYIEPPAISDKTISPPSIRSIKFLKGSNPPSVYNPATIEIRGKCSSSGEYIELYWNLAPIKSSYWTLRANNVLCSAGNFIVQDVAVGGSVQYKVREFPSKNFSPAVILPNGKIK